jgi:Ca2+:H+ antiporter
MSLLMAVASVSLVVPATVYTTLPDSKSGFEGTITVLSQGTAIILLALYDLYLYFQFKLHASFFNKVQQAEEDVEERRPGQTLTPFATGVVLAVVMVFVAVCTGVLISSINPIVETMHISKTFTSLVLLPILGNATERVTAVIFAYKGRIDLAINVVIGSSVQIALFITPFLVILSWGMHTPDPMTLFFQNFETIVFFLSVLVVKSL